VARLYRARALSCSGACDLETDRAFEPGDDMCGVTNPSAPASVRFRQNLYETRLLPPQTASNEETPVGEPGFRRTDDPDWGNP
jgi:hypothetical protein